MERPVSEYLLEAAEFRRTSGNFRHGVGEVLVCAFSAMCCGVASSRGIARWCAENIEELRAHGLALSHGVPSHQTFSRVFSRMPPKTLREIERKWSGQIRRADGERVVALDGKVLARASKDGVHTPCIVSAWMCEEEAVAGETTTTEKSNEITAMPELLTELGDELRGCVVTADAAGCQRRNAEIVTNVNHARYVFGLKGNQRTMHDEFLELFNKAMDLCPGRFQQFETVEKNHGRFERRRCIQTDYVEWFEDRDRWPGLSSVILVEEERIAKGSRSFERRLYASSLGLDAERALRCVRKHWGIENGLHWTLDVVFREDDCTARSGNAAENLSTFRHLIVGVERQVGRALGLSVYGVCFKAMALHAFLYEMLFGKAA